MLCAIPKVACTELIKLVYRMSGDVRLLSRMLMSPLPGVYQVNWQSEPHFRSDSPTVTFERDYVNVNRTAAAQIGTR